jgi:hypothetical protein
VVGSQRQQPGSKQQQQQLDILLRKVFYNFELSCIFIITLLVFFWGKFCKSAAARGERQQLEIVNVVENLLDDLRERERESSPGMNEL